MQKVPSIKELRAVASKQSTNGFLNPMCDFLAFYPAKLFLYLPLNPVQITVLWVVIKIITALLLLFGGYWLTLVSLFVFQLASILDGVDGIVARYRKEYSYNGILFDYFGHYFCNSLLLLCLAWGTYGDTGALGIAIVGGIAAFSYLLAKAITFNPSCWTSGAEQRREVEQILYTQGFSVKSQGKGFMALAGDFFLLDNPLNALFWGVLLGFPGITLAIYAVLLTGEVPRRMIIQYGRIRKYEQKKKEVPG